jgi:hypothetical protein
MNGMIEENSGFGMLYCVLLTITVGLLVFVPWRIEA